MSIAPQRGRTAGAWHAKEPRGTESQPREANQTDGTFQTDRTFCEQTSCLLSLGRQKNQSVALKICGDSFRFQ